jgi:hypothetical protein
MRQPRPIIFGCSVELDHTTVLAIRAILENYYGRDAWIVYVGEQVQP